MIEISNVMAREALKALESRAEAFGAMADMEREAGRESVAMAHREQGLLALDAIAEITEALVNEEK
jgi:delta 1-pyrroline-5-carboxylate dehydrogenase